MATEPLEELISETWPSRSVDILQEEDTLPSEELSIERARHYTHSARALSEMILHRGAVGTPNFWNGVDTLRNLSEQPLVRHLDMRGVSYQSATHALTILVTGHDIEQRGPTEVSLRQRFKELAEQWHQETDHLSSITDIVLNFNYQRIIGMGSSAMPLILEELQKSGGHWFWALRAISGEEPVDAADRGNASKMKEAWVNWSHNR